MAHEVDDLGAPIDPEMRRLEHLLGNLAAEWRDVSRGLEKQDEIVQEYHDIVQRLYEMGWDGELHIWSELPTRLMPLEYLKRQRPE